jgi:hypothetical protein
MEDFIMTQELIVRIMDKAKAEGDHDYVISRAKVREDLRQSGELTEEIDKALDCAGEFLLKLLDYPKTQKVFFAEKFETKTVEDYEKLFEKELEERQER